MSLLGSFFGRTEKETAITNVLDMVTYTANLASNPVAIDVLLDKVRSVTASLNPGQAPAPEDEQMLLAIYIQLEDYLTTKEPIRAFARDDLRARLSPELRARLTGYGNETNQKGTQRRAS